MIGSGPRSPRHRTEFRRKWISGSVIRTRLALAGPPSLSPCAEASALLPADANVAGLGVPCSPHSLRSCSAYLGDILTSGVGVGSGQGRGIGGECPTCSPHAECHQDSGPRSLYPPELCPGLHTRLLPHASCWATTTWHRCGSCGSHVGPCPACVCSHVTGPCLCSENPVRGPVATV